MKMASSAPLLPSSPPSSPRRPWARRRTRPARSYPGDRATRRSGAQPRATDLGPPQPSAPPARQPRGRRAGRGPSTVMARSGPLIALSIVLLLAPPGVPGFKDHEFKKCRDAAFCKRNRGPQDGRDYTVLADSVVAGKRAVTALIRNKADGATFKLELSRLEGGLRVQVTEPDSPVDRFRVPDVLVADPPAWGRAWEPRLTATELSLAFEGTEIRLSFSPFRLIVEIGGAPAMRLNGRGLFHVERHRTRQDGDPEGWWEEKFKTHADSKPRGPQAISLDLEFSGFGHVYGIPEHATGLSLQPTVEGNETKEPYRLYNLDVFEYVHESPFGLYGSIPLMLAHRAGLTVGAFWMDASEMFVDVERVDGGTGTQWIAESGVLDLFLLLGPGPAQVVGQYAGLTGTTAMPQLFALGYHQCRWNYNDQADVAQVDAQFDVHGIPYDVLWLDIEHTDGKKYLTWDAKKFPDSVKMQENVASRGRRMVTIVDPHMKRDSGYSVHKEAERLGHYVKNKDGNDYDGWCWPGSSSYLDVLSPVVRDWWSTQFLVENYVGSTEHLYIWNDMNEPSVFNGPEITMHKDCLHHGNVEHRDVHNMYGYLYHMATTNGLIARGYKTKGRQGDRPFVLSRAFFAGTQRLGPVWTGDNTANWEQLRVSVPMLLSLGLTGLPYSGADVGGFFGNPDEELLTRWTQLGAFYPFFRQHAHIDTKRREIWLFGPEAVDRMRRAIQQRYSLMPYLYTLFRAANASGAPVMLPMWYEFPNDPNTFDLQEQFLFGPAVLVRPVMEPGVQSVAVYLPPGSVWYDPESGNKLQAPEGGGSIQLPVTMESIPYFYRGGYIVPKRERHRRSTMAMKNDPFTLLVALDGDVSAMGDLYLDDGSSFNFRDGAYLHKVYRFRGLELTSTDWEEGVASKYDTAVTIERIVVLGLPGDPASWRVTDSGSGAELAVNGGPVRLGGGLGGSAVVIRKPDLGVAKDWKLTFSQSPPV
ncbi:unnamed protein product [Ostreobium quekettii]|uniref:Glucosidase II subunit alpha n=1 Tax=Ostreobium quekettii TaxID=121088 RepID=A0A8S1IZ66_9CHLO|nr:unnamed protein product [Ostreobium quekettii]|eukprot:evm.model.scf_108.10 EVM.evm.TU.scf_108.10   scf_108:74164-77106(-)